MKIVFFYHSVVSDWNHGNAHFLRGIMSSLYFSGNKVRALEPRDGWSLTNLIRENGCGVFEDFKKFFPFISPEMYSENGFDPEKYLHDADVALVHEWNSPEIVKRIGEYKLRNNRLILLFHDTHHRAVTAPDEMSRIDLSNYDGVLVFGDVLKGIYIQNGWARNVWTWHEAADTRLFRPLRSLEKEGDLVWIGNWGDDERTSELKEFIIDPVRELGLKATFYGVRYPPAAIRMLKMAKIRYEGWTPNYRVPEIFAKYRVTVHVPRRPYTESLPGIPTIRPFEAMAGGIPLICSPWNDSENLFYPGEDYLIARNGAEMKAHLLFLLSNEKRANALSSHALITIKNRHTCDHRARQLMEIVEEIRKIRSRISNPVSATY
jgi:spore maturation protein CgeB